MTIDSIVNGVVIDHIKAGKSMEISLQQRRKRRASRIPSYVPKIKITHLPFGEGG